MRRRTAATTAVRPGRCPACGEPLTGLPAEATFCPSCGKRARPARSIPDLVRAIFCRPQSPTVDTGPRMPVVIGYANALWRLGWRYESGRGGVRNVPEAMRCYRKSARLGNAEAQSRIEHQAALPIDDVADSRVNHSTK